MKKLVIVFFTAMLCLCLCENTIAYDAPEHNRIMEKVLFGDSTYSQKTTGIIQANVIALECASYLCVDQYNLGGKSELSFLQGKPTEVYPDPMFSVPGLPETINEINFNGNYAHRMYTHKGWNPDPLPSAGKWPVRKNILLSTVRKIVSFSSENQVESFAAIIYYIHLLGDHVHDTTYKESRYMMPIARKTPGQSNPDIFYELQYHMTTLFWNQTDTQDYILLMKKMDYLADLTRSIIRKNNEVFSIEEYTAYKDNVIALLNLLYGNNGNNSYFRNLLNGIPAFTTAFGIVK